MHIKVFGGCVLLGVVGRLGCCFDTLDGSGLSGIAKGRHGLLFSPGLVFRIIHDGNMGCMAFGVVCFLPILGGPSDILSYSSSCKPLSVSLDCN